MPEGTDVRIAKTVAPTGQVVSGSLLTYTLTVSNAGPLATANARLADTPSAGLDCTATGLAQPTCSASGGAACPTAPLTASALTGTGVTIPTLPVNGQVAITMQCKVTASGI